MEYKLGLWQSLEAIFVTGGVVGTMFFITLYCVVPIFLYRIVPKTRIHKGAMILLAIIMWGGALPPIWGSGWKIDGNRLHLKAYVSSDDININLMEIGFVKNDSEWKPDIRELGASDPGLSSGRYRLANRKKALVFNHYQQNKLLLISADEKYYLIGHPGIEKLYGELIRLGAKEKNY